MSFSYTIKSFFELKKLVHVLEVLSPLRKLESWLLVVLGNLILDICCFEKQKCRNDFQTMNKLNLFYCCSLEQWSLICRKNVEFHRILSRIFFQLPKNEFPEDCFGCIGIEFQSLLFRKWKLKLKRLMLQRSSPLWKFARYCGNIRCSKLWLQVENGWNVLQHKVI